MADNIDVSEQLSQSANILKEFKKDLTAQEAHKVSGIACSNNLAGIYSFTDIEQLTIRK